METTNKITIEEIGTIEKEPTVTVEEVIAKANDGCARYCKLVEIDKLLFDWLEPYMNTADDTIKASYESLRANLRGVISTEASLFGSDMKLF